MTKTKLALLASMAMVAIFTISFGIATPAQAHCQRGYDCWAHAQGHYRNQQRWSYGQRQMFQPAVRYQQPRHHSRTIVIHRGTIFVPRGTIYIPR